MAGGILNKREPLNLITSSEARETGIKEKLPALKILTGSKFFTFRYYLDLLSFKYALGLLFYIFVTME